VPFESRTNRKEATYTTDISAAGALKSAVEAVQESITNLSDPENYQQRTASGADSFISLTSSKEASVGSYAIEVNALASEHKLSSGAFTESEAVGEGTLTLTSGSNSFDIVTSATDTLAVLMIVLIMTLWLPLLLRVIAGSTLYFHQKKLE